MADQWLAGDIKSIVDYNEFDAVSTYLVWLRVAHFGGFFDDDEYLEEQMRIRSLLEELSRQQGKEHLLEYLEKWK